MNPSTQAAAPERGRVCGTDYGVPGRRGRCRLARTSDCGGAPAMVRARAPAPLMPLLGPCTADHCYTLPVYTLAPCSGRVPRATNEYS